MKKVIVVDWLDKLAGAEKVIQALNEVFHFDIVYSMVNIMDDEDLAQLFPSRTKVHSTWLNIVGKHFRKFLIFFPKAMASLVVEKDVDLVISSSHAIAKGIEVKGDHTIHICYLQARNLKYVWEEADLYFTGYKKIFKPFLGYLRRYDRQKSKEPDYLISNSKYVQQWVRDTYNRESVVIYPSVEIRRFDLQLNKEDYYVTVGRLEAYKRFDITIKAFNELGKKLVIVGDGSIRGVLEEMAADNIEFVGFQDTEGVNQYISKAKGFVFSGIEDFGIAPVEAQACGTPVICLDKGGTSESIVNGVTGIHFSEQSVQSLISAIVKFEKTDFSYEIIRENAMRFSKSRFQKEMSDFVNSVISKKHLKK